MNSFSEIQSSVYKGLFLLIAITGTLAGFAGEAHAQSDVRATNPSVASASVMTGQSVVLRATISNTGTMPTGASFVNEFQIAPSSNGAGAVTVGTQNNNALAVDSSNITTQSHTFTTAGTQYMRVCADSSNSINESDESNNCTSWTAVLISDAPDLCDPNTNNPIIVLGDQSQNTAYGSNIESCGDLGYDIYGGPPVGASGWYDWQARSDEGMCLEITSYSGSGMMLDQYAAPCAGSMTLPAGSISTNNCVISAGNNSCDVTVDWSVLNPTDTIYVEQDGTQFSSANPGSANRTITPGDTVFTVLNGSFELDTATANATCESGSVWNGSVCEPAACDLGCSGKMTYTDPITSNSDDFICPSGYRLVVTGGAWTGPSCSGNYVGSPSDPEVQCVADSSCTAPVAPSCSGTVTSYILRGEDLYPVDCQSTEEGGNLGVPVCSGNYTAAGQAAHPDDLENPAGNCIIGPIPQGGGRCVFYDVVVTQAGGSSCGLQPPVQPAAPDLNLGACDSGEITATWPQQSGVTYNLQYRADTSGSWTVLSNVTSGTVLSGLSAGELYHVQLQASNSAGASAWSAYGTASAPDTCTPSDVCGAAAGSTYTDQPTNNLCTTGTVTWADTDGLDGEFNWSCDAIACSATHQPNAPVNVTTTAGACGTNSVSLDWPDVAGAGSYSVYVDGMWHDNSIGSNYTSFTGNAGQSYSFVVRANSPTPFGVQSVDSSAVTGTVPNDCGGAGLSNLVPEAISEDVSASVYDPVALIYDDVIINVIIGNSDAGTASPSEYTVDIDYGANGSYEASRSGTIGSILGGAFSAVQTVSFNSVPVGDVAVRLRVDTSNNVSESNEGDNIGTPYSFTLAPIDPNVAIDVDGSRIVREGETATIVWSVNPGVVESCTIDGPGAPTGDVTNGGTISTGSFDTPTVSGKISYTITCLIGTVPFTDTTSVETVGTLEEI